MPVTMTTFDAAIAFPANISIAAKHGIKNKPVIHFFNIPLLFTLVDYRYCNGKIVCFSARRKVVFSFGRCIFFGKKSATRFYVSINGLWLGKKEMNAQTTCLVTPGSNFSYLFVFVVM